MLRDAHRRWHPSDQAGPCRDLMRGHSHVSVCMNVTSQPVISRGCTGKSTNEKAIASEPREAAVGDMEVAVGAVVVTVTYST